MAKREAERSRGLSIFWLKKQGYLNRHYQRRSGIVTWTYGMSEDKNSIGFSVARDDYGTSREKTYLKLVYDYINSQTRERESMNYNVKLVTTPCNYGNTRYWFICPLHKNGQNCNKRVGVLYNVGKFFACRHCCELTYKSRNLSGLDKSVGKITTIPELENLEKEVKRKYYRGRQTKKYSQFLHKDLKLLYQSAILLGLLKKSDMGFP